MVALVGTIAMFVTASAPTALAVTYESEPAFCEPKVAHDYLAPLERMPKLHEPAEDGGIGFGPSSLRLRTDPPLVVGAGEIGFALASGRRPIRLPWTVTSTLVEVNGNGRPTKIVSRFIRRVARLKPFNGDAFRFDVPDDPAFYRVTIVLAGASGQNLGKFSSYYRVVRPAIHARLGLNANVYRPESTVFGRVENFGTETAAYGVPYTIEQLEGETWVKAPETPKGPWILPLLITGPGLTGGCDGFWIPPSMAPGIYRMRKLVDFAFPHPPEHRRGAQIDYPHRKRFLAAEFEVLP